jgi:hypothetical protein
MIPGTTTIATGVTVTVNTGSRMVLV